IKRAIDLLGLIHTDVRGPLRHVSRKGASYFLTFADDFSRYGYVYLLKHKHELFENFKVFKSKVELQLGKKIKALRSDRGGEYLSQEFKDYLRYPKETMGYYFYFPPENKVIVARSERTTRAPNHLCLNIEVKDDEVGDLGEPVNYKAAMLDPDKVIWQGAMDEEMNSMKVMKVWIVVDLPPNAKVFRSTWLYKKKTDMNDIRAIRIFRAIATYYDYEIWQMEVKTAFLNGRLDEDIYMEQPEGYVDPKYPNRQALRQWNKRFDEEIKKFRFIQNRDEPYVYRKASGSDVVFLILYVDDILIIGNNIPRLKEVKDYLGKCFSMKDLGEAAYILGIKIYRDRSRRLIRLNQSAYIDKILNKTICITLRKNPGKLHWVAVKHIRKYLRNTRDMFLVYGGKPDTELDVTSFCDASWQCDKDDTKSQMGYVFVVNGEEIRKFVGDLGVMPSINKPINLYCDNSAAIIFANEPRIMKGARDFLQRYHYIREQVETGEIKLKKVHTNDNLADPFTKALPRGMVIDYAKGIRLQLASSFMHTCD
nr:hypothetical protein [Tanacetum cinerariifolium]